MEEEKTLSTTKLLSVSLFERCITEVTKKKPATTQSPMIMFMRFFGSPPAAGSFLSCVLS